eukprot:ctg_466.g249
MNMALMRLYACERGNESLRPPEFPREHVAEERRRAKEEAGAAARANVNVRAAAASRATDQQRQQQAGAGNAGRQAAAPLGDSDPLSHASSAALSAFQLDTNSCKRRWSGGRCEELAQNDRYRGRGENGNGLAARKGSVYDGLVSAKRVVKRRGPRLATIKQYELRTLSALVRHT